MPSIKIILHSAITAGRYRALLIAGFLIGVAALYCVDEQPMNTLPVATIAATDGKDVLAALKADGPTIIHIGRPQVVAESGESFLTRFVLVNSLDVPITYYGDQMYSWSKRPEIGQISPFYAMQTKKHAEQDWQDVELGYCGTGAGPMVVKPGHAGRFKTYLPLAESECRISIGYSSTENGKKVSKSIWSPAIKRP